MIDVAKIKAISIDLDDTLWPIWPCIERAEDALAAWLREHAAATASLFADLDARLRLRGQVVRSRPDLGHNMSALRLEVIREALKKCGDDSALAEPAFDVFFDARMKVDLFDDVLPSLNYLATRYPVVALSNGNADVHRVGIGEFFHASVSAHEFGVGKPDPKIFRAAAEAAGCAAPEVLHIGDDAALDVMGALAVGMQTVWINRAQQAWPHQEAPHLTVSDLSQLVRYLQLSQYV